MTDQSAPNKTRELGIFMPASVDDFGLTAAQFRVLCHLSRRAGKNRECYPSAPSIARVCKLHEDTVWRCLKELEKLQFIKRSKGKFKSNNYTMTHPKARGGGNGVAAESNGCESPESDGCRPPVTDGRKGNTMEGKPNKSIHSYIASVPDAVGVGSDNNFSDIPEDWEKIPAPRMVLPFSSDSFSETWFNFKKHRSEIRCALKPTGEAAALAKLKAMGESDAISAMQTSIANGWRGLFNPIAQNTPKKPGGTSTYELEAIAHGYTL
jgi:GntR family transcriptional regulator